MQYYCSELPFPVIEGIYLVGSCVQSFTGSLSPVPAVVQTLTVATGLLTVYKVISSE